MPAKNEPLNNTMISSCHLAKTPRATAAIRTAISDAYSDKSMDKYIYCGNNIETNAEYKR